MFQSTFPRRERRNHIDNVVPQISFNPRSREGNDTPAKPATPVDLVSIHVPAKGTTVVIHVYLSSMVCFNPRSREGNDETELGKEDIRI